ncbi:MAG: hypothetical protein WCB03_12040 [Rouxiella badensis]
MTHAVEWAYPWNAPRPAIAGPERPLNGVDVLAEHRKNIGL